MKPGLILSAALAVLAAGVLVVLTGTVATSAAKDSVADRLPALIQFVEAERGLKMRRAVEVEVLADEEFVAALHEDESTLPPEYDLGVTYDALGLADAESFDEEIDDALDEGVVGFYDPYTERLVVRERPIDAYFELVLVHELTHALQDQWFMIDRPGLWDLTERAIAFDALVEGDATRVERAWYLAQPDRVRDELDEVQGLLPGEPAYDGAMLLGALEAELDFSYVAGLPFVDALLEDGGQEQVDKAFRQPPTTTEHILHPETLAEGPPSSPPPPKRSGRRVDEGVLGERGLALILAQDPIGGGPQVGWDGDSYVTYVEPDDRMCTVAAVRMTDDAARDRLVAALLDVGVAAEATGAGLLELAACDEAGVS